MKKNRIGYVFLLLLSSTAALFEGGRALYILFYAFLLLPVFSLLYTLIIYFRIKYVQTISKRSLIKGEVANYMLEILNEDFIFYPYIKITFFGQNELFKKQYKEVEISLKPFHKHKFTHNLHCNYRGNYYIGLKKLEIMDFLGLFRINKKVNKIKDITVYPRIIPVNNFELKTDYIMDCISANESLIEDYSMVSDLTKFAGGESLNRVHWKLSAKTNSLIVKQYNKNIETKASIIMDTGKNHYSFEKNIITEDKIIEAAVSLSNYCAVNNINTEFFYFSSILLTHEIDGAATFYDLYETLSTISFNQDIYAEDVFPVSLKSTKNKSNIILITSNLTDKLYKELYKHSICGYKINLIYIVPDINKIKNDEKIKEIIEILPNIGVKVYKIGISDDIKIALESQLRLGGDYIS